MIDRHTLLAAALLGALALTCRGAEAQDTGTLNLFIDPQESFEYVLDHKYRQRQYQIELGTGAHHFSFWAPQRVVVDTTLHIEGGQTTGFTLRLPYAPEYLAFRRDLDRYGSKRTIARIIPLAATAGAAAYTIVRYRKAQDALDQLAADRDEYDKLGSPHRIAVLKEETIPAHKEDFRKARNRYYAGVAATVVCAGATAYLFARTTKKKQPVYEDKQRVRFDGLTWTPDPHGGAWGAGLTWHLAR